jgi:hypothetical protein
MKYAEHRQMIECQQRLLRALTKEMANRAKNPDTWVVNERRAIQQAAYQWASRRGLERRVTMADIERLEPLAVGHVDYAHKLCLYVAEFLYGQTDHLPA